MRVLEIWFSPKNADPEFTDELEDGADRFLAALRKNGQVCGEQVSGWIDGQLRITVYAADQDAVQAKFFSPWAKRDFKEVTAFCSRPPVFNIVDDSPPTRRRNWQNAGCLFLWTTSLDETSPVCSGKDRTAVAVYLLPLSQSQRESIHSWQLSYREHDGIWLGNGELEIPAYRQLADPASELATRGRDLCEAIEQATSLPTYYYLIRHWGRKKGEPRRKCPACGKTWVNKTAGKEEKELNWFDFRCVRCRLVSHLAITDEDERHATIGEYKPRRRRWSLGNK